MNRHCQQTVYKVVTTTFFLLSSLGVPLLQAQSANADAASTMDTLVRQLLPQPGYATATSSGNISSLLTQESTDDTDNTDTGKSPPTVSAPQASAPEQLPVYKPYGDLTLAQMDFTLNSFSLPIDVTRSYDSGAHDILSPFGYGWNFPFHHYIRLYAYFDMTEYLPYGDTVSYTYHKDNPNLLVTSYDGDPLIYYPLDKGYYTADDSTSTLTRISEYDYEVQAADGNTYVFYGYRAPWRSWEPADAGQLIKIIDRHGNTETFSYDSNGNLVKITGVTGRTVKFGYQGHLVTSMTDPLGRTTTYHYDGNDNLISVTHPDGTKQTYTYDSDHHLLSVTDSKMGTQAFTYLGDMVTSVIQNGERLATYRYFGDNVIATYATGHTAKYTLDDTGNIQSYVNAAGYTYHMSYTNDGFLSQIIGPQGHESFTYDANHNIITQTDMFGNKTQTTYDSTLNLPTQVTEPFHHIWQFTYDSKGDLLTETDPLHHVKTFTYEPDGLLASATDANHNTTYYSYDEYGQLATVIDPLNQVTSYTTDKVGRVTKADYPNGNTLSITYDKGDRPTQIVDKSGSKAKFIYDARGLLSKFINPAGAVTKYTYDANGWLKTVTSPNRGVTTYQYSPFGQVTEIIGPHRQTTKYTYDGLGRVMQVSGTDKPKVTYTYDSNGDLIKKVQKGAVWTYDYTPSGQLQDVYLNNHLKSHYDYDQYGNVIDVTHTYLRDKFHIEWNSKNPSMIFPGDTVTFTGQALDTKQIPGNQIRFYISSSDGALSNQIVTTDKNGKFSFTYTVPALSDYSVSPGGIITFNAKGADLSAKQSTSINENVMAGLEGITYDPNNNLMYVVYDAGYGAGLATLNTSNNSLQSAVTLTFSDVPHDIAYGNGNLYITNQGYGVDTVSVVDANTNKVINTINVGGEPTGIVYANGYVYVGVGGSKSLGGWVSVIDTSNNKIAATIPTGWNTMDVTYDSANGYVYATNYSSNTISVIDANPTSNTFNTELNTIPVGKEPQGIAYGNGNLYVVNSGDNTVSVINANNNKLVATINVGQWPFGVVCSNGYVYVTNWGNGTNGFNHPGTVSVINTANNTVVNTANVGIAPSYGAVDSTNGIVYISNSTGQISSFSPPN